MNIKNYLVLTKKKKEIGSFRSKHIYILVREQKMRLGVRGGGEGGREGEGAVTYNYPG